VTATTVRALHKEEFPAAAAVTSRALADSPSSVAIYGEDPMTALAGLHGELVPYLELLPSPQMAALAGNCVVAAAVVAPPGGCLGAFLSGQTAGLLRSPLPPLGDPTRAHVFWAHWAEADLAEEHWHIGPVGVEPGYQGRGLGGAVMGALCAWLDDGDRLAWLETDKARNVRFYSGLGFDVAHEATVLGVETWYMRRDPRP
jgi:ribosomal protein S18 acetylase RimI-like enzyme